MKITKLEAPKPVVAPFVPFTITVETPEEAAALCVVCGDTTSIIVAERATERLYADTFRFSMTKERIRESQATYKVYEACSEALR